MYQEGNSQAYRGRGSALMQTVEVTCGLTQLATASSPVAVRSVAQMRTQHAA